MVVCAQLDTAQGNGKANDPLSLWALCGLHIVFGEWVSSERLIRSMFYCSQLGALKIILKEEAVENLRGNSKGMNLLSLADLGSNSAA